MNKAVVVANTLGMSRPEWLKIRKRGIGGSDAAAILGMNPFSSALAVWADKTSSDVQEDQETESIWLGNVLEEHVARRYAKESGLQIVRCNQILQHPEHPFMLANIDRRVKGKRIGVEIKTTNMLTKTDFANGEINPWYYVQCQHYLAVTGWDKWILVVLVIGRGMFSFEIERNEDDIAALIENERRFWIENVQSQTPPPADGSESAGKILMDRFQVSNGQKITLSCDDDVEQYAALDEQIKQLEKQRDLHKQRIMESMGDAERGEAARFVVTWKTSAGRTTVDSKRLESELPDIFRRYSKVSAPSRRFAVSAKK